MSTILQYTNNPPSKDRLAALYSFTRAQRESNPSGYAFNVKWWSDLLSTSLQKGYSGAPSHSGRDTTVLLVDDELLTRLSDGVRPRGIGGVIDTLLSSNTLVPLQKFVDSTTPIEAGPSIASRVVGAAASVGWSALSRVLPIGGEATEEQLWKSVNGKEYVHIPSVKVLAQRFAEYQKRNPPLDYTDTLYSREAFARKYGKALATATDEHVLSKRDMDVLLRWLERDVGSVTVSGDIVKLGEVISEADRGAVAVTDALEKVEGQIIAAEKEAAECEDKAKKQLKAGKRSAAASYLRSKKMLDGLVVKRVSAGEQLRTVKMALNRAKGDVEIMAAYEESTAALSAALRDPRLSHERIAATTDALSDALADQEEIDQAVRGVGVSATDVDEDELSAELEALVLEEKQEQEREREKEKEKEKEKARVADLEAKAKVEAKAKDEEQARAQQRLEALRKTQKEASRPVAAEPSPADADAEWRARHAEAQERQAAEKQRAEAERLAREQRFVPAD